VGEALGCELLDEQLAASTAVARGSDRRRLIGAPGALLERAVKV